MCRIWKKALFTAFILSALLYGTSEATDFSSDNFVIKDPVITPSAGFSLSSSFKLHSTLGQEAIGVSTANTFVLKGGFLYFPSPTASVPPPTVTPSKKLSSQGPLPPGNLLKCDFNGDSRCNILDLSILLFWADKPPAERARFDLNSDGRIDLADISIIFYFWT